MHDPRGFPKKRRGLKAFSAMILSLLHREHVMEYSRVAEVIVSLANNEDADDKNIRRRIYDALNVMCAVGLVRKKKKTIYLNSTRELCGCKAGQREGLACIRADGGSERSSMEAIQKLRSRIAEKKHTLEETSQRKELLMKLIERNRKSAAGSEDKEKLHFPFLIISTGKKSKIDCETNEKRSYFKFRFKEEYKIYEDVHILGKLFDECNKRALCLADLFADENEAPNRIAVSSPMTPVRGGPPLNADSSMQSPSSRRLLDELMYESEEGYDCYAFTEDEDWVNLYNFLA